MIMDETFISIFERCSCMYCSSLFQVVNIFVGPFDFVLFLVPAKSEKYIVRRDLRRTGGRFLKGKRVLNRTAKKKNRNQKLKPFLFVLIVSCKIRVRAIVDDITHFGREKEHRELSRLSC